MKRCPPVAVPPWCATFLLLVLVCAPATGRAAQKSATLSKGGGPGADKAAALVGHYLRQGLSRDERFELVPMGVWAGTPDRDHAIKSFQEAEEAALKAREAYDRLDLDAAAAQAKWALGRYERYAAYVDDFKKVAETLMLLGAVAILRGDERQGTTALEQAINVYGQVEPDPRVFNPAMRAQFSRVATKLAARAGGTLSVASTPANAEVFVDGQFAGVSPVAVQNVSEGRHFVRLRKDGLRTAGRVMQVISRNETTDSAPLRPAPHFDEIDTLSDHVVHDIDEGGDKERDDKSGVLSNRRALARALAVDTLFVSRVRLDGERVHITLAQVDGKSGRVQRKGDHVFAYDTRKETYEHEVGVLLHERFGADAQQEPSREGAAATKTPLAEERNMLPHAGGAVRCLSGHVSCRVLKNTVGSTLMTLGVGALAFGAVEYALAAKTHSQWLGVNQVDARQGALRARGRNQALTGDVLMGVGAALTVGASLTFALWHPASSAADVARAHAAVGGPTEHPAGQLRVSLLPASGGGTVRAALTF